MATRLCPGLLAELTALAPLDPLGALGRGKGGDWRKVKWRYEEERKRKVEEKEGGKEKGKREGKGEER